MNYEDMSKFMPDEEQQKVIAEKVGKDLKAYKKEAEQNLEKINNDVKFLNENGIARILDDVEIDLIQKEPIIKANLILRCHYKDNRYELILENCFQVGKKDWVFGDAVTPKGEDIQDLIDKNKAKEEAAENKEKGKLAQWAEKTKEASQKTKERRGGRYLGEKFRLQSGQPHSVFYKIGAIGEKLDGYYVTKDLEKHKAKILYQAPEIMHNPYKYLVTYDEHGTMREWSKGKIEAFYVADQLYIFTGEYWDIMIDEGAIRKLGRVVKNNSTGEYVTADLIQKVGLSPENIASLSL